MYVCPKDRAILTERRNSLCCEQCGTEYPIEGGIPIFPDNKNRGYWSNVTRDSMRSVIRRSEETGDWRSVIREDLPECERHIAPYFRGDIQYLFPTGSKSVLLDAGSMWGGITLPIAQHCKEIYAVDKTWESLRFLAVRAEQEGLDNIHVAEAAVNRLPFADKSFDHVILNGVLEWLAMDEEVVLENDWTGKKQNTISYSKKSDPEQVQLEGLQELYRVTKTDGSIYIAIENRIGLQYFLGHPDDHVNVRFVSFLPRALANFITRKIKNHDYRTYIYSPNKLRAMLVQAGFTHVELYSAFPHYNIISRLVPFSVFDEVGALSYDGGAPLDASGKTKVALFSMAWRWIPNPFRKHLCPSISVIATKGKRPVAFVVTILNKAGIIEHDHYTAILANNRFADDIPANIIIRNERAGQLELFCKVSRVRDSKKMEAESAMLELVNKRLSNTSISGTVPELVYWGVLDGVEVQVTRYASIKNTEPFVLSGLIKVLCRSKSPLFKKLVPVLMSRWLRRYDRSMGKAIKWLAKFQEATYHEALSDTSSLADLIKEQVSHLNESKLIQAEPLLKALSKVGPVSVPLAMEHGDYDVCNLFELDNGQLFVVDFEHAIERSLPFFDLGNLLFSTLVQQWRRSGKEQDLASYSKSIGMTHFLLKWLREYSDLSGISMVILGHLPALAVIGQHVKVFPKSRNPADYPMFGDDSFDQMIGWQLIEEG